MCINIGALQHTQAQKSWTPPLSGTHRERICGPGVPAVISHCMVTMGGKRFPLPLGALKALRVSLISFSLHWPWEEGLLCASPHSLKASDTFYNARSSSRICAKNGATIYLSGVGCVGVGALWKLGHSNDSTYIV